MQIGFNLLLWTPEFQPDTHHGLVTSLKETGYDGVELPFFAPNLELAKRTGKLLADEGMRSTAVTIMPGEHASCISPDPASRRAAVDHLKQVVDCCHAAGSEVLMGPFHQVLGVFSGTGPTETELEHGAEVHREVAEYAQQAGIQICVEWLNRFECYFLTTMAGAADYTRRVNHPNFATMFDTFHANIEEKNPVAALRAGYDTVKHIHISENDRGTPGTGHAAIRETLEFLKETGYDRWITVEAFGLALPEIAAATKVWRPLFPSEKEVYTEGIRYIRECWGS